MPNWHIDLLKNPLSTVDIGLIRDEANDLLHAEGPVQSCLHFVKIWLIH